MQQIILVFVQNVTLREKITSALHAGGYLVLAVADEAMALETARLNPLSLAILDYASFQERDLDTCYQLWQGPETAHLPIMLLVSSEAEINQIERNGFSADSYLVKPLSWGELRPRVRSAIRRGKRISRTLLLVEPDATMRDEITYALRGAHYLVQTATDGLTALNRARTSPNSLIILDLLLLQPNDLEVYRQLWEHAKTTRVPILLLINDDPEIARIEWQGLRANHYLKKPIVWKELHACVQALLRGDKRLMKGERVKRSHQHMTSNGEEYAPQPLLHIDLDRHQVLQGEETILQGNTRLFKLLVYLMHHPDVALTREQLLRDVWQGELPEDTRTVDVHIHWLRQKLHDELNQPRLIQTIPGVGYCFKSVQGTVVGREVPVVNDLQEPSSVDAGLFPSIEKGK